MSRLGWICYIVWGFEVIMWCKECWEFLGYFISCYGNIFSFLYKKNRFIIFK